MGAVQAAREEGCWKLEASQYGIGIGYTFFTVKRKEMDQRGYTILDGLADHNQVTPASYMTSDVKHTIPTESFLDLQKFVMETLPGEEVL